jgi:hypothetical protein
LPDDGKSEQLSKRNTRLVESQCMAQIKALQDGDGLARKSADATDDKR